MKVLLTGANGFIGNHIAKEFKKNNCDVFGVGLEKISNNKYLADYIKWNIGHEEIPNEIAKQRVDCIIHAASLIDGKDDNAELIYSNCLGTFRIYELAKIIGVQSIILLSSIPIMGLHCNMLINESTQIKPETMYHATKASQEFILNQLGKLGIRVCSLRIPSPIGPDQPENTIVPVFVRKSINGEDITLSGKGTRKQNYVDARDIANCIFFLCTSNKSCGTYVIGADKTVSNYELAELCIKLSGSSSKIVFNGKDDIFDNDNWMIDCSKLKNEGFKLQYSIENTILDMIGFDRSL